MSARQTSKRAKFAAYMKARTKAYRFEADMYERGLFRLGGAWAAKCNACSRDYEIVYDVELFTQDTSYCHGSMGCML